MTVLQMFFALLSMNEILNFRKKRKVMGIEHFISIEKALKKV